MYNSLRQTVSSLIMCSVNMLDLLLYCCFDASFFMNMQAKWKKLIFGSLMDGSKPLPPLPSRLVTDDDLKEFYEAMKLYDVPKNGVQPNVGVKRKGESRGGLDTLHYGRGKRTREVCLLS